MSAGTTNTILRGLQPDTLYTVSLVPVYAEGEGKTMSENGKTSKTEHRNPHVSVLSPDEIALTVKKDQNFNSNNVLF